MSLNRKEFIKRSISITGSVFLPVQFMSNSYGNESIYDIIVYGATSGGIIAAITAAKKGKSVLLIEPSGHLGGLTTGGLGRTDIGLEGAIGGMALEFYSKVRDYYRNDNRWIHESRSDYMNRAGSLFTRDSKGMFGFEPHAAENIYKKMLREARVPLVMNERLDLTSRGVEKRGNKIVSIISEAGNRYKASIFIDATYEGDLLAKAGASYHVGREANSLYDETLNGVQTVITRNHIFPGFVDPFIEAGNPRSGILPGLHGGDPGVNGEGDHRIQAYCFSMCLTDVEENMIPFEKPKDYDELQYELLFRNYEAGENRIPWLPGGMPNRKTDTNNRWGFSTNQIGVNYKYPDGDYHIREQIIAKQENYQKGLMWTLANHPRIPQQIRDEVGKWGLAADEFTENGGWPTQIYVREARRLVGEYVMTENDCRRIRVADDPVGLGSYQMDSHNVQRYITDNGCVQNEGNIEVSPRGPYSISYRALLPKRNECSNLLVSSAISSSHIAFGSIRMEPVFMLLGQSAATAASLSLTTGVSIHDLKYNILRDELIADGQFLDVDLERFPPYFPDNKNQRERIRHESEPVIDGGCMVTG